jgi:3-hydroxyisobutyrate dehydrogenase
MPIKKIGVIGVGSMGGAIVERLLSLDYNVMVWDIDRFKMMKYAELGAMAAQSAAHLTALNEVVLASLPSPRSVLETFLSETQLYYNLLPLCLLPFFLCDILKSNP